VFDALVWQTYLSRYFSSDTLMGKAELCKGVYLPRSNKHAEYTALIANLADTDPPSIFGLPDNIERSVQRVNSAALIDSLRALLSAKGAAQKFDREVWRERLGPIIETWQKLAGTEVLSKPDDDGESGGDGAAPVDSFVLMEHMAAWQIVMFVDASLKALRKVVHGTGLLTSAVQATAMALLAGGVPAAWEKKWEGPEQPMAWLAAVLRRKKALTSWCAKVGTYHSFYSYISA
jgi:dynein heavy chain 2